MGGGLTLGGGIGCQNHFANLACPQQLLEFIQAQLSRSDAIERRQVPHQHEVASAETARLFDSDDIRWRLDHAELRQLPLRGGAYGAELALREHAAALAVTH